MIEGTLYQQDRQHILLPHVMRTTNPFERMRGLLARPTLNPDQGLLIDRCGSIHTFGMRYPIDLVFLNKDWQVKKLIFKLKPYRMAWATGAHMVIEMLGGTLDNFHLEPGSILNWEKNTCV